ncbi:MAG: hypothetical protein J0M13_02230 [Candidatus Accumulibacter sp.]|nr:hypothetical protein [Candidatus Accumulibacter necessarius]
MILGQHLQYIEPLRQGTGVQVESVFPVIGEPFGIILGNLDAIQENCETIIDRHIEQQVGGVAEEVEGILQGEIGIRRPVGRRPSRVAKGSGARRPRTGGIGGVGRIVDRCPGWPQVSSNRLVLPAGCMISNHRHRGGSCAGGHDCEGQAGK